MRAKKVLYSKKRKSFFFKKFVYFNYYFNFRKKKKISRELIQNYFSIFKSAPDFVVLSVYVNEHWRFEPFKPWNFLDDDESRLWEKMNFL
jgi:hypothetical protein